MNAQAILVRMEERVLTVLEATVASVRVLWLEKIAKVTGHF